MHGKLNERFDAMVERTFSPTAKYAGVMGTHHQLDSRPIGTGPAFEQALHQAQTTPANRAKPQS